MEMDKYIEVEDRNFITAKQTGKLQIFIHDDNGKRFIAMLYDVLFSPELCDQIFSIILLINLVHTYIFHKGFFMVSFTTYSCPLMEVSYFK